MPRVAMASRAILHVGNAVPRVLLLQFDGLVLVAAEAGVTFRVRAGMAGRARRVVLAPQPEKPGMIERRGPPRGLRMTTQAIRSGIAMDEARGRGMARRALASRRCRQQFMRKRLVRVAREQRPPMTRVTGHAIRREQSPVKPGLRMRRRQRHTLRRPRANIRDRVAADAFFRRSPAKWHMARETIPRQPQMSRFHAPWA